MKRKWRVKVLHYQQLGAKRRTTIYDQEIYEVIRENRLRFVRTDPLLRQN